MKMRMSEENHDDKIPREKKSATKQRLAKHWIKIKKKVYISRVYFRTLANKR